MEFEAQIFQRKLDSEVDQVPQEPQVEHFEGQAHQVGIEEQLEVPVGLSLIIIIFIIY